MESNPQTIAVSATDKAVFSVIASGENLNYMWQFRSDDTKAWAVAKGIGYNSAIMTFNPATMSRNGYQYRCKITNIGGDTVYSDIATLMVFPNLTILQQPVSVDITPDTIAIFSVKATGPELSYCWECRAKVSEFWKPVKDSSANTDTLTLESEVINRRGYQFRCKITDDRGNILYTDIVTLNISSISAVKNSG